MNMAIMTIWSKFKIACSYKNFSPSHYKNQKRLFSNALFNKLTENDNLNGFPLLSKVNN